MRGEESALTITTALTTMTTIKGTRKKEAKKGG